MKTFKQLLAELTTSALNSYRRSSEDDMRHQFDHGNWEKGSKRQKGSVLAISKIRNIGVKVKASDSRKHKHRIHPIKIHGLDD